MTIRKRLAHSNIAMLVIPLLTAAVLALLDGVAQDETSRTRYLWTICAKEGQIETLANRLFEFARLDVSGYPAQLEPVTLPLAKEDGHG